MKPEREVVRAADFKAHCLKLMTDVNMRHKQFVITKRGKPVAMLVPYEDKPIDVFGCMQGTVHVHGDIVAPIDEEWDALK